MVSDRAVCVRCGDGIFVVCWHCISPKNGALTIRVFVIAHKSEAHTADDFAAHLEAEEKHCLKLYAEGTMREILRRGDEKGAILVLEVESEEQARDVCADLPFAKLGMLSFDIYPTLPGLWPLIPAS